MIGQ
jgi:hypothetical protein